MNINKIDWSQIWCDGVIFFIGQPDKSVEWNKTAKRWNAIQNKDNYGEQVLKRVKIKPTDTVLDIGSGAGLLAIPMAKKCRQVTALDVSSEMLKYLRQNAEREKVKNIVCINKNFEETKIGEDIEKHDVTIASRSMGTEHNLKMFLENMDKATKKRAYVVWGASDRTFDVGTWKAIGRPYRETRTYIVLYNLLYQMGIRANIEIFQTNQAMIYKNVDEALSIISERFEKRNTNEELACEEKNELKKYLKETLIETKDGTYRFKDKKPTLQALMWWDKKLNP